jgi:hypothetical protein
VVEPASASDLGMGEVYRELVQEEGVEPSPSEEVRILSPVRMPVPPLLHSSSSFSKLDLRGAI